MLLTEGGLACLTVAGRIRGRNRGRRHSSCPTNTGPGSGRGGFGSPGRAGVALVRFRRLKPALPASCSWSPIPGWGGLGRAGTLPKQRGHVESRFSGGSVVAQREVEGVWGV